MTRNEYKKQIKQDLLSAVYKCNAKYQYSNFKLNISSDKDGYIITLTCGGSVVKRDKGTSLVNGTRFVELLDGLICNLICLSIAA